MIKLELQMTVQLIRRIVMPNSNFKIPPNTPFKIKSQIIKPKRLINFSLLYPLPQKVKYDFSSQKLDNFNQQTKDHKELYMLTESLNKIQVGRQQIKVISLRDQRQASFELTTFKTYFTVTFLPKKQLLEQVFKNQYKSEQDNLLTIYKFTCKKCRNKSMRSFPQNGYKYGTVITGCDKCKEILLVSDNLGWIQPDKMMTFINNYGIFVKDILQISKKVNEHLTQIGLSSKVDKQA